jgi:hypothetical protein
VPGNVPRVSSGASARDVALGRFAVEQRQRVLALAEQRVIDAEVAKRAALWWVGCGGVGARVRSRFWMRIFSLWPIH